MDHLIPVEPAPACAQTDQKFQFAVRHHRHDTSIPKDREYPEFEVRKLCSDHFRELRIQKDTSKPMIPVWFGFRSSLEELATEVRRTS
jgi:hypothetical protein